MFADGPESRRLESATRAPGAASLRAHHLVQPRLLHADAALVAQALQLRIQPHEQHALGARRDPHVAFGLQRGAAYAKGVQLLPQRRAAVLVRILQRTRQPFHRAGDAPQLLLHLAQALTPGRVRVSPGRAPPLALQPTQARRCAAQVADPLALREHRIEPPAGKLPKKPFAELAEPHAPQVRRALAEHRGEHVRATRHRPVRRVEMQHSARVGGAGTLCRSLEDAIFGGAG